MDLALGAMGSLLPKLGELLKKEYKMQTRVKQDVESFSRELASMRAALRTVAKVPRHQLDEEIKVWAGDVRELSYDMEDIVDSLLVRVKGSKTDADIHLFDELVGKMKSLFKKGKARRQIATAIEEIKKKVQDVAAIHQRYKADGIFADLAAAEKITVIDPRVRDITVIDPRVRDMLEDNQKIVGIHNSRNEIVEKLCLFDTSKEPKILSIVGLGGLGKTTLAKAVYDELCSKFDCAAFVSVSRSPDLRKVLNDILYRVDKNKFLCLSAATLDVTQLTDELKGSLLTKRYISVPVPNPIYHALF